MIKKLVVFSLIGTFLLSIGAFGSSKVGASVNYNKLIDDFVFSNSSKMTSSQIDSFLNTFADSCISTGAKFTAPDPTGYNPTHGYLYGSNVSAGHVIYDAAQAYDLNPQVLLATLQKEQSLVSGDAGCSTLRYTGAMGYGCPDGGTTYHYSGVNLYSINGHEVTSVSGTCVNSSSKAGFSQQVIHAAWLLKFGQQRSLGNTGWAVIKGNWDNSDDPGTCYAGPMTQGYRKRCSSDKKTTYFDGYTTIDGTSVHMDTGATAALYWYTPHKAGNLNFVNIFTEWFGSPYSNPVRITALSKNTTESGGTATIEFSLVSQPSASVTIPLSVSDASEGTLGATTSVTITTSSWNTPSANAVTVTGVDDSLHDGDVSYSLITGTPSSSDPAYGNLTSADVPNVTLRNVDNEPDIVMVGDWNGNTKDSIGLRRGYNNMINNGFDGHTDYQYNYGSVDYNDDSDDQVLVGDWNGDGKDTIGFKVGNDYMLNNGVDGHTDLSFSYGEPGDVALVGDWNGDGKDTIAIRRGNKFYINNGFDGHTDFTFNYGNGTETVLVGDWNGDGKDTMALRVGHTYYINNGFDGHTDFTFNYGNGTETPLVGDWDGNKKDSVGFKVGYKYYINNGFDGHTDFTFNYGRN